MDLGMTRDAADLLVGALHTTCEGEGWVRPSRFTPGQLRALGSCRAWHPGLYRQMAAATAGVCLAFECDATRVAVEVRPDPLPSGTRSVLADVARAGTMEPPYDGLSAQVDGAPAALSRVSPDVWEIELDSASAPEPGLVRLPGMEEPHRVRVWLPCLGGCVVRRVSADGTTIEPLPPRAQLLVLGDSIAQGFVAGDPALAWPARLSAARDLDLVNQGVGGQVFQPGSLAGLGEAVRPGAIVVELGENYRFEPCLSARVEQDVRAYLHELSQAFPEVPTWVVTPMPHLDDVYHDDPRSCCADVAAIIGRHVAAHSQMCLVDGGLLLDEARLGELVCDRSDHPGPGGQEMIARRLAVLMEGGKLPLAGEAPAASGGPCEPQEEVPAPDDALPDRRPAARGRHGGSKPAPARRHRDRPRRAKGKEPGKEPGAGPASQLRLV